MLKITKSHDPITVEQLVVVLYSPPGTGKTSMGFTADAPLLLDCDKGAYRSGNRGDSVQVASWADVASITQEDVGDYKTIVVDTAGRALDMLTEAIIKENSKNGTGGGALSISGYGVLKSRFIAWTKMIRGFGLDIVLLAHSDEQRKGDDVLERLDVQGGSKNEIYKTADLMGRISIKNGARVLNFSPTDTAFGKNPAQLPPLPVPDFSTAPNFLGETIRAVKSKLNELSASQVEVNQMLADWKARLGELKTAEEFTDEIVKVKESDARVQDTVKKMLVANAKALGFQYDTGSKQFKAKEEQQAA